MNKGKQLWLSSFRSAHLTASPPMFISLSTFFKNDANSSPSSPSSSSRSSLRQRGRLRQGNNQIKFAANRKQEHQAYSKEELEKYKNYYAKKMGKEYFFDLFSNASKDHFKYFFKNYQSSKYYNNLKKIYYYLFK